MVKSISSYICQSCGAAYGRWQGKCDACGGWNTLSLEAAAAPLPGGARPSGGRGKGRPIPLEGLTGVAAEPPRTASGIGELDRVTGGGFVKGSVILIGGDPGIGKSTLLTQACAALARRGERVLYISGEEAVAQVQLPRRASRAGRRAGRTRRRHACRGHRCDDGDRQTGEIRRHRFNSDHVVEFGRERAGHRDAGARQRSILIRQAKDSGACVILVGHVTKDGQIAGPRVVEHMVDAVISFEGDGGHHFRILRAVKNRFGPTDEIGVFEMTGGGLSEVVNPSALFLAGRDAGAAGAAVFAGIEGTRPVLVEIQALVAPSSLATPRRAVVGWDPARLSMVLAVLEARGGLKFGQSDIYLNVAGGLRINEPAADLAAAAALTSSLAGAPLAPNSVYFGEIGLSGAVRPVSLANARLKEAAKLGFQIAHAPAATRDIDKDQPLSITPVADIGDLIAGIASRKRPGPRIALSTTKD